MKSMREMMKLFEGWTLHDPLGVVAKIRALDDAFIAEWDAYEERREEEERQERARSRPFSSPPIRTSVYKGDRKSPFHLSPCGRCRCPVWQQPCPVCNYYPMGDMDDGHRRGTPEYDQYQARMSAGAKEKWFALVQQFGNIAVWFFQRKLKTVAGKSETYKNMVAKYSAEAANLDLPPAEQIWAAYSDEGR
jgi:hypothetical protein